MDITTQETGRFVIRFQRSLVLMWNLLRQPRTTGVLLALLILVLGLALLLPQQAEAEISAEIWTATLPVWLQGMGEFLFFLRFSQIFRSLWFWLPVALLLLNSLIALADYGPPSWRRFREVPGELSWQHPLARRVEYSNRLPAAPDEFLEQLKGELQTRGFVIDQAEEENRRLVSARRRSWSWLSVPALYGSLLILCLGFLTSRYSLQTDSLTLAPFETSSSPLLRGTFELDRYDPATGRSLLFYKPSLQEETAEPLTWQLYRPRLLGDILFLPVEARPLLTAEVQDEAGEARTLFSPLPDDRSPTTKLNLPLLNLDQPLYFLVPSAALAFQIIPSSADGAAYQVQVTRSGETTPLQSVAVESGETFEVENLAVTLSLNHSLRVIVRRDWGLPLYLLSLPGLLGSLLACLLFPPWQLWLIPEVKGRGGQLYGVAEKLGSAGSVTPVLEQLLTQDNPALETAEPEMAPVKEAEPN